MAGLTIWCNATLGEPALKLLRAEIVPHRLVFSSAPAVTVLDVGRPDPSLASADVAFGQPDPDSLIQAQRIRWVHITSAGFTRYDRDDLRLALRRRGAFLTNSSHVFDEPCAQHALAMILALERQLPQALANQRGERSWPIAELRASSRLLNGQTVLLLSFGAIAKRLAQLLALFHVRLIAVRRKPDPFPDVDVVAVEALDRVLPMADHVVNILPENSQTVGSIHAGRFALMKRGAYFYNIGRGPTIDQDALIAALKSGHLGAAFLDVTVPEPLPPGHPLWTAPRCFITPHTAGGHADEEIRLVRHFLANLQAYTRREPLVNRIF